jgi:hypothetical protein
MATTHKLTNVIKVVEFADITNFLVNASREEYNPEKMIDLLQKQTEAKQNKFWKYYDNETFQCDDCGKRQWKSSRVHTSKYEICSKECAMRALKSGVTVDYNEAAVLANLAQNHINQNSNVLTAEQFAVWNLLINKLKGGN